MYVSRDISLHCNISTKFVKILSQDIAMVNNGTRFGVRYAMPVPDLCILLYRYSTLFILLINQIVVLQDNEANW